MTRTSKNRPQEISSKIPPPVLRTVVAPLKAKPLDPRFDRSFGHLNTDLFKHSYEFVENLQNSERTMLMEATKKETDPRKRDSLQQMLSRMDSREASKKQNMLRQEIIRQHRKLEAEQVSKGKRPFFLKKADQKKLELVDKYNQLKAKSEANGTKVDLERLFEKRRKHKASKQHRSLPPKI